MIEGWFKVYRAFTNSARWLNNTPFDERSAFIDLQAMANYAESSFCPNGMSSYKISAGTLLRPLDQLADRWKWSKRKVQRYLKAIEKDKMVTLKGTPFGMLITINEEGLQALESVISDHATVHPIDHATVHARGTPVDHATVHPTVHHNKKDKKGKKDNKTKNQEGAPAPDVGFVWGELE